MAKATHFIFIIHTNPNSDNFLTAIFYFCRAVMNELEKHKQEVINLCKAHGVILLYAFGSSIKENFTENSDIDLLVTFGNVELKNYFSNFLDLKEKLESVFHRKVDLVEEQTVKNPILKNSINRTRQLIYG
jgi:hypothetical protein